MSPVLNPRCGGIIAAAATVSVFVVRPENERGQILLSLKRALVDVKWEMYEEYLETGEAVEVEGVEVNKGGMIVQADGTDWDPGSGAGTYIRSDSAWVKL